MFQKHVAVAHFPEISDGIIINPWLFVTCDQTLLLLFLLRLVKRLKF